MGYIVDTHGDELCIESRRESTRLFQSWPDDVEPEPKMFGPNGTTSVEIENAFLARILAFFDNPENRKLCGLNVPPPLPKGE